MEKPEASTAVGVPEKQSFGKYESFEDYKRVLLQSIMNFTAAANKLPPPGQEHDYYSSFPLFKRVMGAEGQAIMEMMSSLASQQVGKQNMFQAEGTDFDEKVDLLTEVNDVLLERAGISLDVAKGVKQEQSELQLATVSKQIDTIWNRKNDKVKRDSATSITLLTAKNVTRPQLSFPEKIDNSNSLFVPIIKEKPNAKKPLAILIERHEDGREVYSHPYEVEIETFQPSEEHIAHNVKDSLSMADTPLHMVNTSEAIDEMMAHLRIQKCIAIDLEHHSFRSFQGFTCLVQISTWEKDYIVDPLVLRAELHIMNEVTTDPRIVKVLHGAVSDVQWLQRDFGIYIVNLFDTGVAAKLLNFERLSLSYLLKYYMSVEADKRFQLVDWRIRPLPEEMIAYARGDTHYLLPIFERMKRDLADASNTQGNLLRAVWERSSQICLRRYEKPLLTEDSHLQLTKASHKKLNDKQMYALKHLYAWRDRLAREHDESTGYVLPNHMLLQMCEVLPREIQGIIACCNPCPPLVKQQLHELHQIILKAREVQLSNPILNAPKLEIPVPSTLHMFDMDNMLHIVHDIPVAHAHDDTHVRLPTLIDDNGELIRSEEGKSLSDSGVPITVPRLRHSALFPHWEEADQVKRARLPRNLYVQRTPEGQVQRLRMITPYERYVKEVERTELERDSLNKMLQEARENAELCQPQECETSQNSTAPKEQSSECIQDEEDEKDSEIDEEFGEKSQESEPTVIRGARSRKRKREEPSIPFAGGEEISYANTQTSKLERRKRKKQRQQQKQREQTQPFNYAGAIAEQSQQPRKHQNQQYNNRDNRQDGHLGSGGRGQGKFYNQERNRQRQQFDGMEELGQAASNSEHPGSRGGTNDWGNPVRGEIQKVRRKHKFHGGNRSMIVSRSGGQDGGVSSMRWPSK
ncbi:exosome component 10-like isoform X2 [Varroa jacobsoni]|uniref:exosome component 10-like isoform X2 n=1 Tax=Varroa jacobsoni TaxID=62625 RepID=UPI000BF562EA|nr:exosome component 10-like isoform X2 [Varroa jacobsoni]